MRLYQAGGREDLFTPIDGAVAALRFHLDRSVSPVTDRQLASALALADTLEWSDENTGALHRAMRRLGDANDPFAASRDAFARLAGRI